MNISITLTLIDRIEFTLQDWLRVKRTFCGSMRAMGSPHFAHFPRCKGDAQDNLINIGVVFG